MIHAKCLGGHGRLGNAMFQYAASRALAERTGAALTLPDLTTRVWHNQPCLLPHLFKCLFASSPAPTISSVRDLNEAISCRGSLDANFLGAVPRPDECLSIYGHFENERYFADVKECVIRDFQIQGRWLEAADAWLQTADRSLVAIHVRRGDYADFGRIITTKEWLVENFKAAQRVCPDAAFVIFVGGAHSNDNTADIAWCREALGPLAQSQNVMYRTPDHPGSLNDTMVDFAIMYRCNRLILTSPSTIAWWAAYLGKHANPSKRVWAAPVEAMIGENLDANFWPSCFDPLPITTVNQLQ